MNRGKSMEIDKLLTCMKINDDGTIQRVQLKHRLDLVEAFGVKSGMRVLEIGCGQGDTTVALASVVGERGHITAIDNAGADYGAPTTLGEATETILHSKLGDRITFHLETDFLEFPEKHFDIVVLSHCSWYFQSPEQLQLYFEKIHRITDKICVAEWDVSEIAPNQYAHFTAVQVLTLHSEFVENDGNIQHVFGSRQLTEMLKTASWKTIQTSTVDAHYLQDGQWEIEYALSIRDAFHRTSSRVQSLVNTLYGQLDETDEVTNHALNSIVLIGTKGRS